MTDTPTVTPGGLVTVAFLKARIDEGADHLGIFMPLVHDVALLHESSLARTMPTDRILTCRCDTTLVGQGRSSDSGSHSRGRPHSPARLGSGREDHLR